MNNKQLQLIKEYIDRCIDADVYRSIYGTQYTTDSALRVKWWVDKQSIYPPQHTATQSAQHTHITRTPIL